MSKRIVLALSCLALFAVASLSLRAAGKTQFAFSPDGKTVWATNPQSRVTPAPQFDAGLKMIAGNFSRYPFATYFSIWGNTIAQGGANFPFQTWVAVAFTPTADATVTKIATSAGRQGGGVSGFEIGLYNDAGGIPGAPIKTVHVAKLPHYGECCDLSVASVPEGIPVTAGTQYWVVVSTTENDPDIYAWAYNSSDMRAHLAASWCQGSSTYCGSNSGKWVPFQYVQLGFAVLGN
jgi:hypothetical protein